MVVALGQPLRRVHTASYSITRLRWRAALRCLLVGLSCGLGYPCSSVDPITHDGDGVYHRFPPSAEEVAGTIPPRVYDFSFSGEMTEDVEHEVIGGSVKIYGTIQSEHIQPLTKLALSAISRICPCASEDLSSCIARTFEYRVRKDVHMTDEERFGFVMEYWLLPPDGESAVCTNALASASQRSFATPFGEQLQPAFSQMMTSGIATSNLLLESDASDVFVQFIRPFCRMVTARKPISYGKATNRNLTYSAQNNACQTYPDLERDIVVAESKNKETSSKVPKGALCGEALTPCVCAATQDCAWIGNGSRASCIADETGLASVSCEMCIFQHGCPVNRSHLCAMLSAPCDSAESMFQCMWDEPSQTCIPGEPNNQFVSCDIPSWKTIIWMIGGFLAICFFCGVTPTMIFLLLRSGVQRNHAAKLVVSEARLPKATFVAWEGNAPQGAHDRQHSPSCCDTDVDTRTESMSTACTASMVATIDCCDASDTSMDCDVDVETFDEAVAFTSTDRVASMSGNPEVDAEDKAVPFPTTDRVASMIGTPEVDAEDEAVAFPTTDRVASMIRAPEVDAEDGAVAFPTTDAKSHLREASSTTVIIFDWDDTLFPTSVVNKSGRPMSLADIDHHMGKQLCEHALLVRNLLRTARTLGRVCIVTLASRSWVKFSAHHYLLGVDWETEFRNLDILVVYAREALCKNDRRFALGEDGVHMHVACKAQAMSKALKKMRFTREASQLNMISYGDSTVEAEAAREVAWVLSVATNSDLQCKTVKLRGRPHSVGQMSREVEQVFESMERVAKHPGEFDIELENVNGPCSPLARFGPEDNSRMEKLATICGG
eukprot:TRINITY_DN14062_c0_g1_i1.p1 TRINITY_DN14062_c0_g1~~TRINITY_DN14062_c0_g1_i1.p1  ORF type:complete len:833 (+),score=109.95 TRINITY_DN14062_c0_g1_i1:36-2534(+)